jgi:2-oxoglutarate ferredoxin oxidoreductase subunit beta
VYGNVEPAFDLCELAHAAGATYVARGTSWAYQQLANVIAGGIAHRGFAMVEAMAVCPVYYGRFNLTPDPAEFLRAQKAHAVPADKYHEGESRSHHHYPVGLLHHAEREEYVTALQHVRERALEGGDG